MIKPTIVLLLLAAPLAAQTCVKQPPIAMNSVDEWVCAGISYSQAWDVLSSHQVAPVRPARVSEMSIQTNYRSRRNTVIRALQIIGFGTGLVAGILANNADNPLTDLQMAGLISGPKITEAGIQFFSRAPEAFQFLPDDPGFTTIFALASNKQIVPPPSGLSRVEPQGYLKREAVETVNQWVVEVLGPPLAFTPTHWSVLLAETARERNAALGEWRKHEIAWRAMAQEDAAQDAERKMNFHEAERLMAGVR